MESPLDKMASVLDTTFIDSTKKEVVELQTKKNEVKLSMTELSLLDIEDREYIRNNIKMLITSTEMVLERLNEGVRIGATGAMIEGIAQVINAVAGLYKELREINTSFVKLNIEAAKLKLKEPKDNAGGFSADGNKITMTTKQLFQLVKDSQKDAKENSCLKSIDGKFDSKDY